MAAPHYFEFLGTVWQNLTSEDRERFAELWHGYEQVFAAAYQKFAEVNLNIAHQDMLAFTTDRWLPYLFNDDNRQTMAAIYTSSQDLSLGINLTSKYLLKLSYDDEAPVEVDLRGVVPESTTVAEIVEKINDAIGISFARGVFEGTIVQLVSPTVGINSRIRVYETSDPAINACEFVLGIGLDSLTFVYPKYPHIYTLPYDNVESIPILTDTIRDESVTVALFEDEDYGVDGRYISFAAEPPTSLWAKRTLINNEDPWNNYGFLMDIHQVNSERYVEVLRGLWFAYWSGPKPTNVRTALYLLFGLPVALDSGVVTSVTSTHITLVYASGVEQVFEIPSNLNSEVVVGQAVDKYTPLTDGILVFDKISHPGFIADEVGREGIQRFLTENASRGTGDTDETKALRMLEEYTYLPQINVDAFVSRDINFRNVLTFLNSIKPNNKTHLFQVIIGTFEDPIEFSDKMGYLFDIDLTQNVDSNETTYQTKAVLDAYETSDNDGLNTDPHGILFEEKVEIEVRSFGSLIDEFEA